MQSLLDLFEVTKEELNPDLKKYRLYCDMDGVLCDFAGRFEDLFGKGPREIEAEKGIPYFWGMIRRVGAKYWSRMPWTPGGKTLWNAIKQHNPILLTAPPRAYQDFNSFDPAAVQGKSEWAQSNLGLSSSDIIFKRSKDKKDIAAQDVANGLIPILIDDRDSNIADWKSAGGIGIYHPENGNPSQVIKKIKELYEGESTEEGI